MFGEEFFTTEAKIESWLSQPNTNHGHINVSVNECKRASAEWYDCGFRTDMKIVCQQITISRAWFFWIIYDNYE